MVCTIISDNKKSQLKKPHHPTGNAAQSYSQISLFIRLLHHKPVHHVETYPDHCLLVQRLPLQVL